MRPAGVIFAELLVIAALSLAVRLLQLARIPRAVPIAASALMTIGMIWFFVPRLRT